MFFKYGNYKHADGMVNLVRMTLRPRLSRRGTRREIDYQMHVRGELITREATAAACQADLNDQINALANGYFYEGFDAGLYHDDGTPTNHFLQSNHPANVTKNRVLYRSWPAGGPEEYATARTFSVGIGATFVDAESPIEFFQETITTIGTGGPDFRIVETQGGLEADDIVPVTKQSYIQEGMAVGVSGYPLGVLPGPILPQWERQKLRRISETGGRFRGQGYTDYVVRWRYVMETPGGNGTFPPAVF